MTFKKPPFDAAGGYAHPCDDPHNIILATFSGITLLDHSHLDVLLQMSLPGVVIFVHGVNSDGEWYDQAEEGLCKGLNDRLKRNDEDMAHPTPKGGQLRPATYLNQLTDDGFINPQMKPDNFISTEESFSPVIRFRWGYKAGEQELQDYGDALYLNEEDYWGGGPFANGCSSLADLWSEGLSDTLFLWLHIQHLNPVNDRNVYSCPPRPYFVLAALRLARLVESIRKKQADVPITIVCHSQGNMVGMAAAFLGDRMKDAVDGTDRTGRCVADNYVLCNAPYSLLEKNPTESWIQGQVKDKHGKVGRQTFDARVRTMANFFAIVRKQASKQQDVADIDMLMANNARGFDALGDRVKYGYGTKPSTLGRVTLYCNPHDQVISATTVQGIGWRGMSAQEITATKGGGTFSQRVFAQDFEVGHDEKRVYHYWDNHYAKPSPKHGGKDFWMPVSQLAKYSLNKGLDANETVVGKVMTVLMWPIMKLAMGLARLPINAVPPANWSIPLTAPRLPELFKPQARRFGAVSEKFDEGCDPPSASLNKATNATLDANDPYKQASIPIGGAQGEAARAKAAPKGDRDSEAALRYEDHALLRMQAKREKIFRNGDKATDEDHPELARQGYKEWRAEKIKTNLADNIESHATDHSTIMTNGMHARRALAYDVAVGISYLSPQDLRKLRTIADWRFLEAVDKDDPHKVFEKHFTTGKFLDVLLSEWVRADGNAENNGGMPEAIIDEREYSPPSGEQS